MSSIVPSARVAIPTLVNKKNLALHKVQHENKSHNSEPACHLAKHPAQVYTCDTACTEKTLFGGKLNTMEGLLIACSNQP